MPVRWLKETNWPLTAGNATPLANTGVFPRDVMPETLTPVPAAPRLKATFAPGMRTSIPETARADAERAQAARLVDHGDPPLAAVDS